MPNRETSPGDPLWRDPFARADDDPASGRGSDFSGRGPRGYRRSDGAIREDLCERLTRAHDVDPADLEVLVADGEVVLTGTVETRELKRRIEDIALDVFGVREVDNRLRVGLAIRAPRPDVSAEDFDMPWPHE